MNQLYAELCRLSRNNIGTFKLFGLCASISWPTNKSYREMNVFSGLLGKVSRRAVLYLCSKLGTLVSRAMQWEFFLKRRKKCVLGQLVDQMMLSGSNLRASL
ncbi:hypothetical protein RRG08_028668 [Elysia crispata]|uniref:Uncharacterized protein n=1 Tax=Elysia crispata TaxID=231223 RepID=A0AAE0ZC40_9GAST|nr:hypothetical protein RRG08_028668 [Elysia crispata]